MRKVVGSFLLAVLPFLLLLALPVYTEQSAEHHVRAGRELPAPTHSEPGATRLRHVTLVSVAGPRVFYMLAIPVLIAGTPLVLRSRTVRFTSAALLMGWVVIGSATVGLLYLPSAIMMIVAARAKFD